MPKARSLANSGELMMKFLEDRRHLSSIVNYVSYSEEERPHLLIAHPAILATFMGYLKFQTHTIKNKEVFFRGQTENYKSIIPSLLRGDDFERINKRSKAFEALKIKAKEKFSPTRFKNETIDNLFQHYGIKSKTLDLVDNLYVAIWFATNKWEAMQGFHSLCTYKPSTEKYGWIYFMHVERPRVNNKIMFDSPKFTGFCDLRKFHSSLSARLHCQHGITYFRNNNGIWTEKNRCFDNKIIAVVKFPNSEEFRMNGTIFTKEFLFPNSQIDNTYKLFMDDDFKELIRSIEVQYQLDEGELGKIWVYNF